jgi:RNA-directed DNA polymerase
MALSGDETFRKRAASIIRQVTLIADEEGFAVHHRKTRTMARAHRQVLASIVVNDKPNVARAERDRLKAILTNCVRHGPASQNRDGAKDFRAQLLGHISHVRSVNPEGARKLEALLARIKWSTSDA